MYRSKQIKFKKGKEKKKEQGTHHARLRLSINKLCSENAWVTDGAKGVTSIAYLSLPCFNSLRTQGGKKKFELDSSTKMWVFLISFRSLWKKRQDVF